MKNTFRPSDYSIQMAVREAARYEGIYAGDDYVMKDHGDYVQLMVPSSAAKGHDTYDLYSDGNGRLTKVVGHSGNAGFTGTKYF